MSARFTNRGIAHELVDVTEDAEAFRLIQAAGFTSVPVFDLGEGLTDSMSAALAYSKTPR